MFGRGGLDASIAPELEALPATRFEVAASITAFRVNLTCVGLTLRAVVNTRPSGCHRKRHLSEMAWLELPQDVLPPEALPSDEICRRYQDGAWALVTACAARQAIEVRDR